MYVTDDIIRGLALKHGEPHLADFAFAVSTPEFERMRRSQKNGRRHDFTIYAIKDGRVIVIAKPFYPPGLYRAPSGGLQPGESPEAGIAREMLEETGCRVSLGRFLLSTRVRFVESDRGGPLPANMAPGRASIDWRSYVFAAEYVDGDFAFTDTHEIREVRLASWSDFAGFARIMRGLDVGGLHYRAALHETVEQILGPGATG